MAKPKVDTIVKIVNPEIITVYANDLYLAHKSISTIEGITHITNLMTVGCLHIWIDPRYDIQELRDEIEELLKADVPDVFKE